MIFYACHDCAVAVVNDDLSGLEYSNDADDMDRIVASIEAMGLVTLDKTVDYGWYFDCFICDEVCNGEMNIFERA